MHGLQRYTISSFHRYYLTSAVMPKGVDGNVCPSCKENEIELYLSHKAELDDLRIDFNKLWSQCQRCQKHMQKEVLCSNCDCPIFYRRKVNALFDWKYWRNLENPLRSDESRKGCCQIWPHRLVKNSPLSERLSVLVQYLTPLKDRKRLCIRTNSIAKNLNYDCII